LRLFLSLDPQIRSGCDGSLGLTIREECLSGKGG
jgi:hypothetical protein